MFYRNLFAEAAPGYDPRHIEGIIRTGRGTLGNLSKEELNSEIEIAKACIDAQGKEWGEKVAQSWGLK